MQRDGSHGDDQHRDPVTQTSRSGNREGHQGAFSSDFVRGSLLWYRGLTAGQGSSFTALVQKLHPRQSTPWRLQSDPKTTLRALRQRVVRQIRQIFKPSRFPCNPDKPCSPRIAGQHSGPASQYEAPSLFRIAGSSESDPSDWSNPTDLSDLVASLFRRAAQRPVVRCIHPR